MPKIMPVKLYSSLQKKSVNTISKNNLSSATQLLTDNIKKTLPIVAVPIVAYYVNDKKLSDERGKIYHPYTDAVKNTQKEFTTRGLPWNDAYADTYSGGLSEQGNSIITNYDENKIKFTKAGLDFNNFLVNSSTGKLNTSGQSIWHNYQNTLTQLNDAHIPYNTKYINPKTGHLTPYHKKQLNFTGSSESSTVNSESYNSELDNTDVTVNNPPAYNDVHSEIHSSGEFATIEPEHHDMGFGQISAGLGELQFPEGAEITEQLGHVADMLDNPVLEGVAAELLPGTKFLKPGKDLIYGDYEKAA